MFENKEEDITIVLYALIGVFGFILSAIEPGLFITNEDLAPITLFSGSLMIVISISLILLRIRKKRTLNKLASLIRSSNLRRISDISHHSGIAEKKVINYLRILIAGSEGDDSLALGNDARYLKGAKVNLQTMEIILSDKYIEKEDWTCVYCRAVNAAATLTCQACQAPKKKLK